MNFKNIVFGLCLSLAATNLFSQELVRPVITGAPFLQIVPDAHAGGMGEVGVSSIPDAFAQFHNPAKFLFMQEGAQGVGLSYIPQFVGYADDIFYANAGYYQKINDNSALSGSLTYFSYGSVDMEEQMGDQIISVGSFVPNEFALDAAYSLKLSEKFGMSVTGRYVRSDITDNQNNTSVQLKTGQAVSADVSGYYISQPLDMHVNRWTFGFSLKNIGSKLKYADESGFEYSLPTSLKIGSGFHLATSSKDYLSFYAEAMKFLVPSTDDNRNVPNESAIGGIFTSFTDAPDGFSEEMKEVILSLGTELNFNENFNVRVGYITQNKEKGFKNHITVGAGLMWNQFMFDFAYQSPISDYISFNQDKIVKISLSFKFDKPAKAKYMEPVDASENTTLD
ncbi:type IX secretion system outer membrane channel protein PorV [Gillisia sp. M10.2A]|uniref:Type IX secretion system outer membrane channel protein PorV n=1 Tax=Gillisia lutea TaxID=2909668 RepID=A0ABS9EB27_9FLAO|nr:type IX secretion system outer membrane channel protein PorV [Gillisia lutea]MCF4100073.1 type IX secretion system outer membrane channel protein PorV [Gillisia lutea]